MGISRFFKALHSLYMKNPSKLTDKKALLRTIRYYEYKDNPKAMENIDYFYIDANSILYHAKAVLYEKKSFLSEDKSDVFRKLFDIAFEYIELLISIARPINGTYICLDGVCPKPKQEQQRRRRYRKVFDEKKQTESVENAVDSILKKFSLKKGKKTDNEDTFDTNAFTPGTECMYEFSDYLHYRIRKILTDGENWPYGDIYFSDANEQGEGEHKIMQILRREDMMAKKHCVYGLDADLIVLSVCSPAKRIYLLRENVWTTPKNLQFHWVNISVLRSIIVREMHTDTNKMKKKDIYRDFAILTFLLGNDFLPHIPCLENPEIAIPALFEAYQQLTSPLYMDYGKYYKIQEREAVKQRKKGKYIRPPPEHIVRQRINDVKYKNGFIVVDSLKCLCQYLAKRVNRHLLEESHKDYKYPDTLLASCVSIRTMETDDGRTKKYRKIDLNKWRNEVDIRFIKGSNSLDIDSAITKYIHMLNWVCTYYFNGVVDWKFEPTFTFGPSLQTLAESMKDIHYHPHYTPPPSIPVVMLCVLPKESERLIPKVLREYIYTGIVSVVREGTDVDWGGVVSVTPSITNKAIDTLEAIVDGVRHQTDIEWLFQRTYMQKFSFDSDLKYTFSNQYGEVANCHTRVLSTKVSKRMPGRDK